MRAVNRKLIDGYGLEISKWQRARLKAKGHAKLTERMRVLIVANLLNDLGVPDVDLLTVLERHEDFRQWMDAPITM
jgi:hypothetical protein